MVRKGATGWSTLTGAEWVWIIGPTTSPNPGTNCRASGSTVGYTNNARYTHATINTDGTSVNGIILFPDGVDFAASEFFTLGTVNGNSAWGTKCTSAEWTALAAKGCVFLPAAGNRSGTDVSGVGSYGYYWSSSSPVKESNANRVNFYSNGLTTNSGNSRSYGYSVRLVRAVE